MPIIAGRASAAYGAGFAAVTTAPYLGPYGAYDSITAVTVPSSGVSRITFAAIPTEYKHLQLRMHTRTSQAAGEDNIILRFNNDTASNYSWHYIFSAGNGSAPSAGASATADNLFVLQTTGTSAASYIFGTAVIDILDFNSSTRKKTVRSVNGYDRNGSGYSFHQSGFWNNSEAITSIDIVPSTGFSQHTSIALYGVK
jgi:hypothetical protein